MFICASSYSGLPYSMQVRFEGSNYQMISRILFVGVILSLIFYNVYVAYEICKVSNHASKKFDIGKLKKFCTEFSTNSIMFFLSFVFGLLSIVAIIMKPDNVFNVIENVVSIACWILLIFIIVPLMEDTHGKRTFLYDILLRRAYCAIVCLLIQYSIYSMYYGIFQDEIYSQDPNIHNENHVILPCIVIGCGLISMVISSAMKCYETRRKKFEISYIRRVWLMIVVSCVVFILGGFCVVRFGVKLADLVALFLIFSMNIIVELIKSFLTIYRVYKASEDSPDWSKPTKLSVLSDYKNSNPIFSWSNVLMMSMWMIFGVWYGSIPLFV